MKIQSKTACSTVPLGEIAQGKCFLVKNEVYVRGKDGIPTSCGDAVQCTFLGYTDEESIGGGEITSFLRTFPVTPIKSATLILER